MNCDKFKFVIPQISISVNYRNAYTGQAGYEILEFAGIWQIEQNYDVPKRIKSALANNCLMNRMTPALAAEIRANKQYWQPFSPGYGCDRFYFKTLHKLNSSGTEVIVDEQQFMSNTPVVGSYVTKYGSDPEYVTPYEFYISTYTTQINENWWKYQNIKPTPESDPFYQRAFEKWNAQTENQKKVYAAVSGGFDYYGDFQWVFSDYVSFDFNGNGGTGTFSDGNGTASLSMSFDRPI
jgi:hypothetical protein